MSETMKRTEDGGAVHEFEVAGQKVAINLTAADIERIITAAIKTAKEPDEETQLKIMEEKERREQAMRNMVLEAKQMEEAVLSKQSRCNHRKPDNNTAIHGQIHSDGLIHPLCIICQKLFKPYPAPREMVTGMGIG